MDAIIGLNSLPEGFKTRAPQLTDGAAIAALVNAEAMNDGARQDTGIDDVTNDWDHEGIDPAQDAWVVCASDGEIVGYEIILNARSDGHFSIDGYVHPAYKNLGIGTHLLRLIEARVRQRINDSPEPAHVTLVANTFGTNTLSRQLFGAEGYAVVRQFWRMEIDMDAPPAPPTLADGITIRTAVVGQDDVDIFNTFQDSFADHWDFSPPTYESWRKGRFETAFFDPSLWFMAMAGNTVAGVALCRVRPDQSGWINTLGVRREYRKRGIASALLRHAFGEFYRRGNINVGLGVDTQSLTGATRVYEGAGMHVTANFNAYEKTIRSGEHPEQDIL